MTDPVVDPAEQPAPAEPVTDAGIESRLREFLTSHGGTEGASADVAYLGRPGARVVVVAADGAFADAVVTDTAAGELLCERLGVLVQGWTREAVSRIDLSAADRRAMAGR